MLKTVKINVALYRQAKAYAKEHGLLLQYVLSVAIRQYLDEQKEKEKAAA